MIELNKNYNKYTYDSLNDTEKKIITSVNKIFDLEEWNDSEDRAIRIKTCNWYKFRNFLIDTYKRGIEDGRKKEKQYIKKLINKK